MNTKPDVTRGLVAHRGYMHRYPENSLRSLQAALEAGAKYIEFDIQMNADQEFVVLHDADFERTSGQALSVVSADTAACKAVSVHHPERFGQQYFPTPVSMLGEILELARACPGAVAVVEIKEESIEHWGLDVVMPPLLEQLQPFSDCCMLISFSDAAIEYAQANSRLMTGWVLEEYTAVQRRRAASLKPDFLMTDYELLGEGELPWPEFPRWMLYDVMEVDRARDYFEAGVVLIETAKVAEMLEAFPGAGRH